MWKLHFLSKPKTMTNPLIFDSISKMYFNCDVRLSSLLSKEDSKSTHLMLALLWNGWVK